MTRLQEIVETINASGEWPLAECIELCDMAGLGDAFRSAGADEFESIIYAAADILGIRI